MKIENTHKKRVVVCGKFSSSFKVCVSVLSCVVDEKKKRKKEKKISGLNRNEKKKNTRTL